MGRIELQFRSLLASITIAYLLISPTTVALPSQEWKPGDFLFEPLELPPDIATKAPLMRRALGESGPARASYLRQVEAAAVFEASRLAARARREREAQGNQLEGPDELSQSGHRSSNSDYPVPTGGGERDYLQPQNGIGDSDDPNAVTSGAPIVPTGAGTEKHSYPRDHHHSHHPDDHSQGGHSEHWFEHHGLKPASYHRSHHHGHHHVRQGEKGPSRLLQVRGPAIGDDSVTLIAPPSAQLMAEDSPEVEESETIYAPRVPSRMIKQRALQGAEASDGEESLDNSSLPGGVRDDELDKRGTSKGGNQSMDGIPGIIDLMQGSPDGEKLGGLSVSSLSPNDTVPVTSSDILALLIDSTPNLIDQATFFLHTFKDQSTLDHENSSPGTPRDLLVALEVPHIPSNSMPQRMCATFNPLEMDIQVFGLALCMDQDSATNNRRMSQAFRYSPKTGILAPFYAAEGARELVLAAVNERIQAMDLSRDEQRSSTTGWNGTGIYDLDPNAPSLPPDWTSPATSSFGFDSAATLEGGNSTYKLFSELDSISHSSSSKTIVAAAPTPTLLLSVNETSMVDHPLVIGGPIGEAASTASEGASLNVVMVFRSNMESNSWHRTKQDVDTPVERRKALETYQEIGLASKDATELDHWAAIDKIQPNSSTKPSPEVNSSGANGNTTGLVVPSTTGARKTGAPVGLSGEEHAVADAQSDKDALAADSSEDDSPPTKPVINVAYFGDSGRSAPVPPDQQADFARPILVADPLAKPHAASKLVATHPKDLDKPEGGPTRIPSLRHGHGDQTPAPGVMAAMSKSRIGPPSFPVDASD